MIKWINADFGPVSWDDNDVTGVNIMQSSPFALLGKLRKVPEALVVIRDWQAEHLPAARSSAALHRIQTP
ncbi:hypothetical protein IU500_13580 [Nocardia terpenica]|uniref:hypothetical protein n=1 Tax=Nocardia terpenica TaxID=455432 RepID=UPI0018956904|nr:hypothetical protein [Nocardia terpenica]MBF6062791.1 hypothetical protein [Nocardia terpenica]MBF6105074.1 hypothetical protein [Nocardia terpenica]MBF6112489.1 hypothetical protein [Nocardia terpenica]MBF6118802.1 hypothetical protein [Nocardia terpenica]MBF6154271.1 hypothetical protein [Nocardia terpenica]